MSKLKRKLDKEDTTKIQTKVENEAKVKFESMETELNHFKQELKQEQVNIKTQNDVIKKQREELKIQNSKLEKQKT